MKGVRMSEFGRPIGVISGAVGVPALSVATGKVSTLESAHIRLYHLIKNIPGVIRYGPGWTRGRPW